MEEDSHPACYLCDHDFGTKRQPTCPSCVQALLYEPRIHQAAALIARENAHKTVEAVLSPSNDGLIAAIPQETSLAEVTESARKHSAERMREQQDAIEQRIAGIIEQAELLRQQVEGYKTEATMRKVAQGQRRAEIMAEMEELARRQPLVLGPVETSTRKVAQRVEKARNRTVDARAYLCRETAELCGLRRRKREGRDGTMKDAFEIGGVGILDLRELNSMRVEQINTSLGHICHLLWLCCHYLSVRLPAEITMPRNDYPHATINPPLASYQSQEQPYPGFASGHSSTTNIAALRTADQQSRSRPRVLCLTAPLPKLAKDDPKAYGLFIEGVTLLAWNVAWLCKVQGVDCVNSFEDLCALGRNLWQLFVDNESARQTRPPLDSDIPPATEATSKSASKHSNTPTTAGAPRLGDLSHASAHQFLIGAEVNELLDRWKLASPHRIIDKLKTYLLTEMSGAEWEMLDEQEWNVDREDEEAVLVGGERMSAAMSVMTVTGHEDIPTYDPDGGGRGKGTSGWTKVRGRGGDGQ